MTANRFLGKVEYGFSSDELFSRRKAKGAIARRTAILAALVGTMSLGGAAQAQQHGISFLDGTNPSAINIGDPYASEYTIRNTDDTTDEDVLTVTAIIDSVHAFPADVVSGNLLPLLTVTAFNLGSSCNPTQTLCTLPPGSSIEFAPYSHYSVDEDDYLNADTNQNGDRFIDSDAELIWQDQCESMVNNCPFGDQMDMPGTSAIILPICEDNLVSRAEGVFDPPVQVR